MPGDNESLDIYVHLDMDTYVFHLVILLTDLEITPTHFPNALLFTASPPISGNWKCNSPNDVLS